MERAERDGDGWIDTDAQTLIDTDKHLHSRQMDRVEQTDRQIRPDINKADRQLDKTDRRGGNATQPHSPDSHSERWKIPTVITQTGQTDADKTGMEMERYTTMISNTRNAFRRCSHSSL